mmetsp:Transcript_1527/g.2419  ORF Transcript_1527/g.2419 Transcript_1527/m.2419 type:complete len:271 (-) Transcript_1527:186-998(-)
MVGLKPQGSSVRLTQVVAHDSSQQRSIQPEKGRLHIHTAERSRSSSIESTISLGLEPGFWTRAKLLFYGRSTEPEDLKQLYCELKVLQEELKANQSVIVAEMKVTEKMYLALEQFVTLPKVKENLNQENAIRLGDAGVELQDLLDYLGQISIYTNAIEACEKLFKARKNLKGLQLKWLRYQRKETEGQLSQKAKLAYKEYMKHHESIAKAIKLLIKESQNPLVELEGVEQVHFKFLSALKVAVKQTGCGQDLYQKQCKACGNVSKSFKAP